MMRILVTGGAGYIGSHAVRLFLERGHEVSVYDNLSRGHAQAVPAGRLIVGDLADERRVETVLREKDIEAVMHFAAFAYVGESVREPAQVLPEQPRQHAAACWRRCGAAAVQRFVFSSTGATYGVPLQVPITEDEPQKPINPYGQQAGGRAGPWRTTPAAYGLGYAALRYFNAAGASRRATSARTTIRRRT